MKISRHLDVITNPIDLKIIEGMVNVYNSARPWHFQGSTELRDVAFFFSDLTQSELNLFQKYIQPILNKEFGNTEFLFERAYINCQPPGIGGNWHTDGTNGITILYYPKSKVSCEYAGTEFEHHGVEKYIENSIIIFQAEHKHRAIAVTDFYRFSIAIKLNYKGERDETTIQI